MKVTCKYLKSIISATLWSRVYKSGSNVRIDLEYVPDEGVEYLRSELRKYGIVMFRDDVVHLPNDYIVREELG